MKTVYVTKDYNQLQTDVNEATGLKSHPKVGTAWALAWTQSHAHGILEVGNTFLELATLITDDLTSLEVQLIQQYDQVIVYQKALLEGREPSVLIKDTYYSPFWEDTELGDIKAFPAGTKEAAQKYWLDNYAWGNNEFLDRSSDAAVIGTLKSDEVRLLDGTKTKVTEVTMAEALDEQQKARAFKILTKQAAKVKT